MLWYKEFAKALEPIEGHTTAALVVIAGLTLVIAIKGDAVMKMGWLVYLLSP